MKMPIQKDEIYLQIIRATFSTTSENYGHEGFQRQKEIKSQDVKGYG